MKDPKVPVCRDVIRPCRSCGHRSKHWERFLTTPFHRYVARDTWTQTKHVFCMLVSALASSLIPKQCLNLVDMGTDRSKDMEIIDIDI